MKNTLILLAALMFVGGQAQEQKTWRLGIQFGNANNKSKYIGGSSTANARFEQQEWGSGALSVHGRYDFDRHWMLTGGIGIHSIGFGYSIANNYSLLKPDTRKKAIKSDFAVLEMPLMVYYKFNPNCKNAKWLVGAGMSEDIIGTQTINKTLSDGGDGSSNQNYISSTSSTKGGLVWNFRWSVAREKTFKNNSILNAAVVFNVGLSQVATSTVNYSIDNQMYTHEFSNNGNFVGLRLTYFFKPFVNPWEKSTKAVKTATTSK